ncbi:hypothetical protein D9M71_645370 [compost metagenome]
MIDHGQAQAIEALGVLQRAAFTGDDDRQVVGIGQAQAQLRVGRLEAVGAAQQVDATLSQGGNRLVTAGEALHRDRHPQLFADQPGIVSAQAFVVTLADIDFKGRVVGARTPQYQALALGQPLAIPGVQLQRRCGAGRTRQQLPRLGVGQGHKRAGQTERQEHASQQTSHGARALR